ncbi:MATE family efflux transporter [Shewanella indica]|uniref:Multidrug export protein MepA n=1 Tax=Shewanella indica TaxID=768528 RepID=A0ABU4Q5X2_9GAMM|nr:MULTISPECIES: MATE family efflux transporter [Shewanella]OIN13173.1 MATE family efflux transporter [Shewanella algae]BCV37402.1 multidrug transporter MatE [Shewanella chilikensis]MCE9791695.1 MATE family efflux transporter [Shewanella indica]MDX6014844.1 MATE family efflux transporter [Shewanella indica]NDO75645.1 MATE family efflux transporter [Shewanella sp. SE1]
MTQNSVSQTEQDLALLQQPVSKLFWRYTVPTVMSMLVTGIYVTVDGMFIGHYLGETGLAGIMLAYPVGAILYAIGALLGMGGAALISINLGRGDVARARKILGNTFSLCLLSALVVSLAGTMLTDDILRWLKAEGEVYEGAYQYLFWYFALGIFPIISMAFSALLRNDGRPSFVTWILVFGGVLNTLLDWLFIVVFPFGLTGAAIATMLSQAVTGGLCLQHFFGKRTRLNIDWQQMKLSLELVWEIVKLGMPSFLMNLYLSIVLTMHNMALLWTGTSLHVAAYGVVSYTEALFYFVFEGIALGTQPILSFNAGAGQYDRVKQTAKMAFSVTLICALLGLVLIYSRPEWMVYLFAGDNPTLAPVAIEGMYLYFWGLPMEGLILVGASFFQAINRPAEASILTGSKLLLIGLFLWVFAWAFGVPGVWISLASCSSLLCLWMFYSLKRTKVALHQP